MKHTHIRHAGFDELVAAAQEPRETRHDPHSFAGMVDEAQQPRRPLRDRFGFAGLVAAALDAGARAAGALSDEEVAARLDAVRGRTPTAAPTPTQPAARQTAAGRIVAAHHDDAGRLLSVTRERPGGGTIVERFAQPVPLPVRAAAPPVRASGPVAVTVGPLGGDAA